MSNLSSLFNREKANSYKFWSAIFAKQHGVKFALSSSAGLNVGRIEMPTTTNPFQDDAAKAEVFEQGLIAGFNDPDGSDFRPLPPDLLEVFQQGFQVGRGDKSSAPAGDTSLRWLSTPEADDSEVEALEHIDMLAFTLLLDHIFETAKFSLIEVAQLALSPGGDTPLRPLPPDFRVGFNVEDTDPAIHFIAVCPRSDHAQVSPGVTSDGHWIGQDRSSFLNAVGDMTAHEHSEAFVARCDFSDNTCGPVWLAAKQ